MRCIYCNGVSIENKFLAIFRTSYRWSVKFCNDFKCSLPVLVWKNRAGCIETQNGRNCFRL